MRVAGECGRFGRRCRKLRRALDGALPLSECIPSASCSAQSCRASSPCRSCAQTSYASKSVMLMRQERHHLLVANNTCSLQHGRLSSYCSLPERCTALVRSGIPRGTLVTELHKHRICWVQYLNAGFLLTSTLRDTIAGQCNLSHAYGMWFSCTAGFSAGRVHVHCTSCNKEKPNKEVQRRCTLL